MTIVTTLRDILLRTRQVAAVLLFRWMAACGPTLLNEGRDSSRLIAYLRIELRVPSAFIATWRRMPAQRAAGWHATAES
jgi:hypothetical protein